MKKILEKERASRQKRKWVRLTKTCNNNCIFCLDKDNQDGTFIPFSKIKQELKEGIETGAERAVLSGGEPTLHPQFLEVVKFAKELGYKKIQIVTNGRMFSYKGFLKKAIERGVDEITFSIHGHNKKLYELQSRVRGSFEQAMAGLINALNLRKPIVNIDIVINKINYRELSEMIEFFIKLGVYEFDLLQPIPFGAAWKNKEKVFYDIKKSLPYLRKTFEISKKPKVHLWTNRFPPSYLEGFEDLIQDPVKLYGEVEGKESLFKVFLKEDKLMPCWGERCKWCFLKDFCSQLLLIKNLEIKKSFLKKSVTLIKDENDIKKINFDQKGCFELAINKKTKDWILRNLKKLYKFRDKIVFFQENHRLLSQSKKNDINLRSFFSKVRLPGFKIKNIPICLYPKGEIVVREGNDISKIDSKDFIDIYQYTDWFILNRYYTKSLRCRDCQYFKSCPGMHINYIRNFGYKVLSPLKK